MDFVFENIINEVFYNARRGVEAYTRMVDVEKGLDGYNFSGKIVYCPCDSPNHSNFCKYFELNAGKLGGLYCSSMMGNGGVYSFDKESKTWKYGGGASRFQDNHEIFSLADVIVTNPPFSGQCAEIVRMSYSMGKDFVFVGPKHLITRKDMFELFKNGHLNAGNTKIRYFINQDGEEEDKPTYWWTSFNVPKAELHTGRKYEEGIYQRYDNYDAIECPTFKLVPEDYDGLMGVPFSAAVVLNKEQFEVVDLGVGLKVGGSKKVPRIIIRKR